MLGTLTRMTLGARPTVAMGLLRATLSVRRMHIEKVSFGNNLPGYVTGPEKAPAVIMLQEWWGITEEIRKQAKTLAGYGYRVLLPDLYKGKLGLDAEEAAHLMGNLDFQGAIEEIKQASKYLKDAGSPTVGITGFCMGGALTLCGLQHDANLACGVVFYGIPGRQVCQPEKIKKPVQCHFGELDNMAGFSDMAAARALVEKFSEGGVEYEMNFYTGVGHAFMNDHADQPQITKDHAAKTGFPPSHDDQRSLAWSRMVEFFDIHLKEKI